MNIGRYMSVVVTITPKEKWACILLFRKLKEIRDTGQLSLPKLFCWVQILSAPKALHNSWNLFQLSLKPTRWTTNCTIVRKHSKWTTKRLSHAWWSDGCWNCVFCGTPEFIDGKIHNPDGSTASLWEGDWRHCCLESLEKNDRIIKVMDQDPTVGRRWTPKYWPIN